MTRARRKRPVAEVESAAAAVTAAGSAGGAVGVAAAEPRRARKKNKSEGGSVDVVVLDGDDDKYPLQAADAADDKAMVTIIDGNGSRSVVDLTASGEGCSHGTAPCGDIGKGKVKGKRKDKGKGKAARKEGSAGDAGASGRGGLADDAQGTGKASRRRKKKAVTEQVEGAGNGEYGDGDVKKKKKRRQSKEPKPHKEQRVDAFGRVVRYAPSPSQKVLDRIERAMPGSAHRMFLIDTKAHTDGASSSSTAAPLRQIFTVLGATGNVYDVTIGLHPDCTCPDFRRGNLCKHVLFVMLRVLKVDRGDPRLWQRGLLRSEVEDLLAATAGGGLDNAHVFADQLVRSQYQQITGGAPVDEAAPASQEGRRPIEGDCPICFEELTSSSESLVWCRTCGNNMHEACFNAWSRTKRRDVVTCVLCRNPWHRQNEAHGAGKSGKSGYVNLAHLSKAHEDVKQSRLYDRESRQWQRFWRR